MLALLTDALTHDLFLRMLLLLEELNGSENKFYSSIPVQRWLEILALVYLLSTV